MFVFSATKYVKLLKYSQLNLASPETTLWSLLELGIIAIFISV